MGTEEAVAAGMLGGMFIMMSVCILAFWILLIVARWKIFTKAGEAGWKSIIPFYADYIQWRIGWNRTNLFWVYLAGLIVGYLLMSLGGYPLDGSTATAATMNMPLVGIGTLLVFAAAILGLIAAYKLFQSFGYGVGFFILYIFLSPIALLILGFGSARWTGPMD